MKALTLLVLLALSFNAVAGTETVKPQGECSYTNTHSTKPGDCGGVRPQSDPSTTGSGGSGSLGGGGQVAPPLPESYVKSEKERIERERIEKAKRVQDLKEKWDKSLAQWRQQELDAAPKRAAMAAYDAGRADRDAYSQELRDQWYKDQRFINHVYKVLRDLEDDLQVKKLGLEDQRENDERRLSEIPLDAKPVQWEAAADARVAYKMAESAYNSNQVNLGDQLKTLGGYFVDVALGMNPWVGFPRDAFEMISGHNMLTGEALTDFERFTATVSVATLGTAGLVKSLKPMMRGFGQVVRITRGLMGKVPPENRTWETRPATAESVADVAPIQIRGQAPAEQGKSTAALEGRTYVSSGGRVYRQGTFGRQNTGDAQFWGLKSPASVRPGEPTYSQRYGTTTESTPPDWFMGGTLKEGKPFVTRESPPVGSNPGGEVEIVVNPGDIEIDWFHTIER